MKVTIDRLDDYGRGITTLDGKITFIENALPGEVVDISVTNKRSKYNEGVVTNYYTKSELRRKPRCIFYEKCGGCALRHMHYVDTLSYKKDKLYNILKRYAGIDKDIKVIKSINKNFYRNKIELKCINKKYGFYAKGSHDLVNIDRCLNAEDTINKILLNIEDLNLNNGEVTIKCNFNEEVLLIIKSKDIENINIEHLISKNKIVGIIYNDKTIYGVNYFLENINGMYFKESYDSFFQVNRYINSEIFKVISDNIGSNDNILELCCGVGTLRINASKKARKVTGIEIVPDSIKDANFNKNLNNIDNVEFILGDANKLINEIRESIDVILIDPPRSGLTLEGIDNILKRNASRIIYVSCNPITMARDIKLLNKYDVSKVYLLDNFPYTYHIESICILDLK